MKPNIPRTEKPTTGRLWYGNRVIAEKVPFRNLQQTKITLIQQGYDKKLFKITY